ncbi:hypothetical protein CISIN_1g037554mg, partial [Citrus sinensis]
TGGGNALNVQRTVKDLVAAGAAGCFLEDQSWPKKCGHMHGKQIIPAEEHAAKIASARDAIGDSDFVLARADASFVEAPRNDNEANWVWGHTLHTPEELKAMGFHLTVHPLTALYASARALVDVLKTLKESGTTRDHLEKMGTFEEFNQLVNLESWFEIEGRYSNFKKAVEKKY